MKRELSLLTTTGDRAFSSPWRATKQGIRLLRVIPLTSHEVAGPMSTPLCLPPCHGVQEDLPCTVHS